MLTLIILLLHIYHSNAETILCDAKNTGSCKCNKEISGETCTLDCTSNDACQDGKLKCRSGDNCIIDCSANSACSGSTIIDANGAIDVTVICGNEDSCKGSTHITCGTGICTIECSQSTSCEDITIDATDAWEFTCTPTTNCQQATQILTPFVIQRGVNEALIEPPIIDLTNDGASLILYTRLCKYIVTDSAGLLYIRMTRYCYCTDEFDDSTCSIPGPTLLTKGNIKISITQVNQLTGANSTQDRFYHNQFQNMDSTNIHTHGIHVSPFEDDVFITVEPGLFTTYTYTYGYHYPGTYWYHAHHHGSVAYQVDAGLHGALIMTSDDALEINLQIYKENILLFNWQYPLSKEDCIGANANRGGSSSTICRGLNKESNPNNFIFTGQNNIEIFPDCMCDIYCRMPTFQLDASGFVYDVETQLSNIRNTNGNIEKPLLFFVNGQIAPRINDLEVGIFRRLRLVNSLSIFFIQFQFPSECQWYLIAQDGVYLDGTNINYDLSGPSHQNELLVGSGSRADVMVKCNIVGTYNIIASENNILEPEQLPSLVRVPDGQVLFSIVVNERKQALDAYNGTDSLPVQYPERPTGSYVEDTTGSFSECDCNKPNNNNNGVKNTECKAEFTEIITSNGVLKRGINNKPFDLSNSVGPLYLKDSLSILGYNKLYQFTINNINGHIFHQHTNPFQYVTNVGQNGFIALAGSWSDTFGNDGNIQTVNVNMWTRDYWGLIILHCHLLEHEDTGMMGHLNILPDDQYVCPWSNGNNGNMGNNGNGDNKESNGNNGAFGQNNEKHKNTYDSLPTPKVNVELIMGIIGIVLIALFVMIGLYYVYNKINKQRKGDHIAVNDVESDYDNEDIVSENENELQLVEVNTETNDLLHGEMEIVH